MAKAKREPIQDARPEYGITQTELEEYLVTAGSASMFAKDQEARRDSLKSRIAAGARSSRAVLGHRHPQSKRSAFTVAAKVIQSLKVVDSELLGDVKAAG